MNRRWTGIVAILTGALLAVCPVAARSAESTDPSGDSGTLSRVGRSFSLIWDPEILEGVREIAETLVAAYGSPRDRYHIYIVRSGELNAFTTASGDIFLFSSQLLRLRSEDELAAVLSHEMAHQEADHFARMSQTSNLVLLPTLAAIILSGGNPAVIFGAASVAASYQLSFSRDMETEADIRAVNALKKTAYNPLSLAGALEAIEREEQLMPMDYPEYLMTHPVIEVRRASLESVLGKPLQLIEWTPVASERWQRLRAMAAGITADPGKLIDWEKSVDARAPSARERHLTGLTLLKGGYPGEAVRELRLALEGLPDNPFVQADLGAALHLSGDPEAARPYLEAARKALPNYSYPLFYLAEAARQEGRSDEAAIMYQKSADARPELPEAFAQYSTILARRGQQAEASYYLGVSALLEGRFKEASSLLKEARAKLGDKPYWKERLDARQELFR